MDDAPVAVIASAVNTDPQLVICLGGIDDNGKGQGRNCVVYKDTLAA